MEEYFDVPVALSPRRLGFGKKPALLLVDFQNRRNPWKSEMVNRAVKHAALLLKKAREKGIPVFYTVVAYREDLKDFVPNKMQPRRRLGTSDEDVVDELKPGENEVVIVKKANSAFLGTNLLTMLNLQGVDTMIITGCHTSGCIRATASDSYSLGFRTILPEECIADEKGWKPHKANLCDLHIRGADVIALQEVMDYLDKLE
jgi:maleamate amidohydrolase